MFIEIQKKFYPINTLGELQELVVKYPRAKDIIFNQFAKDIYLYSLNELLAIFPGKEMELFNETLKYPLMLYQFLKDLRNNTDSVQVDKSLLSTLRNFVISRAFINSLHKTIHPFHLLEEIVKLLPEVSLKIYFLTVGNPAHFKEYVRNDYCLSCVRELFPTIKELKNSDNIEKVLKAVKIHWQNRNEFRKNYREFYLMSNRKILFHRVPKDITKTIISMTLTPVDEGESKQITYKK